MTTESLSWYKDDTLEEKKYTVILGPSIKLRQIEKKSVFGAHHNFQIYNEESRNVYKDHRYAKFGFFVHVQVIEYVTLERWI